MIQPVPNKIRRALWSHYRTVRRKWGRGETVKISLSVLIKARELGISKSTAWNIIKTGRQNLNVINV